MCGIAEPKICIDPRGNPPGHYYFLFGINSVFCQRRGSRRSCLVAISLRYGGLFGRGKQPDGDNGYMLSTDDIFLLSTALSSDGGSQGR